MIDYDLLIISIFSLLFFVVIGGTILLFPLSRKLGHLIEARTQDKKGTAGPDAAALRQLAARLDDLERQVGSLAQRQEFLDRMLEPKRTGAIGEGGTEPPGAAAARTEPE